MGFYFDGSGQRTHRHETDDLDREDVEPLRPSPGKSSRTHGGGDVLGIPGKISLTARLAQRIDRYARTGHHATPDEYARDMVAQSLGSTGQSSRTDQGERLPSNEGSNGRILDSDAVRAHQTRTLLSDMAAALGLPAAEVTIHVDQTAGQKTRARGARGLMEQGIVYLDPGAYPNLITPGSVACGKLLI